MPGKKGDSTSLTGGSQQTGYGTYQGGVGNSDNTVDSGHSFLGKVRFFLFGPKQPSGGSAGAPISGAEERDSSQNTHSSSSSSRP